MLVFTKEKVMQSNLLHFMKLSIVRIVKKSMQSGHVDRHQFLGEDETQIIVEFDKTKYRSNAVLPSIFSLSKYSLPRV